MRCRHLASQSSSAAAAPSTGAGCCRAAASWRASAQRILLFSCRHAQRTCMAMCRVRAPHSNPRVHCLGFLAMHLRKRDIPLDQAIYLLDQRPGPSHRNPCAGTRHLHALSQGSGVFKVKSRPGSAHRNLLLAAFGAGAGARVAGSATDVAAGRQRARARLPAAEQSRQRRAAALARLRREPA